MVGGEAEWFDLGAATGVELVIMPPQSIRPLQRLRKQPAVVAANAGMAAATKSTEIESATNLRIGLESKLSSENRH